jgi:hypothetical protein
MNVLWLVVLLDRAHDRGAEEYILDVSVSYIERAIGLTLDCDEVPDLECE